MAKQKKAKAKKAEPKFKLSLDIGDEHYKSDGATALECLEKIQPDKFKLKTFGFFTLRNKGMKAEAKKTPFEIRRITFNKVAKEILADRLSKLLK